MITGEEMRICEEIVRRGGYKQISVTREIMCEETRCEECVSREKDVGRKKEV